MRFPLARSGSDKTPIAWWEWLFAPIMMPLFILFLFVMAVVSVPAEFVYRLRQHQKEKQLKPRLAAAGRFMEWAAVEAKLHAGKGTLIVEHLSPNGPIRDWWVDKDLIATAPVSLPASLKSLPAEEQMLPLQQYTATCASLYTNLTTGSASLTVLPVPFGERLNPVKNVVVNVGGGWLTAIMLVTGRRLAEKYPAGKVVTLVTWLDKPLMFVGDAESVFVADTEPPVTPNSPAMPGGQI